MLHAFLASAKRRRRPKEAQIWAKWAAEISTMVWASTMVLPASILIPSDAQKERAPSLPSLPSAAAAGVALFPSQQHHLGSHRQGKRCYFWGIPPLFPSSFFRYLAATIEKIYEERFQKRNYFLKERRREGIRRWKGISRTCTSCT